MAESRDNLPNLDGISPFSFLAVILRIAPPSPEFPSPVHFSGIFRNNLPKVESIRHEINALGDTEGT
jgi:hypothetical protein